ncbi:TioE family transcriptional regulator [Paenibacillus campinasensis]|uniref:Transcriptional regulator n=1 Tax=Paenibacillus campinasensis TaxID=66347 RepID=A0A268EWX5_9BACL|nr:TioE family transcriptional regulator [Paenibacillus campinasensis]PAD77629.1 transcriptional regulator [Paenibacillus campinasensis]
MRYYKPKEIADELQISTSALRHYEAWGVVPPPERAENGHRLYTSEHVAYFRCLRAMFPGFGYGMTYEVLRFIQKRELDDALWLVNAEQAKLQQEKMLADQTLALLEDPSLEMVKGKRLKPRMTIGEVAELADVETSAIRHWEKEGLLSPERNPDNGYRLYTPLHVRQILLIRSLRKTVFFLEKIKGIVQAVEHQSIEQARKMMREALSVIHERIRQQFYGVYKLVELCIELGLIDGSDAALTRTLHTFEGGGT